MMETPIAALVVALSSLAAWGVPVPERQAVASATWVFEKPNGETSRQPMDPGVEIELANLEASFIRCEGLAAPDAIEPFRFQTALLTLNNGDRVLGVPGGRSGRSPRFLSGGGRGVPDRGGRCLQSGLSRPRRSGATRRARGSPTRATACTG